MKKTLLTILAAAASLSMAAQETVYFQDDFEWLEPWSSQKPAGNTIAENNADATAQQLGTNKVTIDGQEVSTYDALLFKGYEFPVSCAPTKDPRKPAAQSYLQRNYLKFGLTDYFTGITLPKLEKVPAEGEEITLSFDWCSQRRGNSETAIWDPTALVVIVKNGDTEKQYLAPTHKFEAGSDYEWINAVVSLKDAEINGETRITIRNIDEQWPGNKADDTDKSRWFIDNIKLSSSNSSGVEGIIADNEAPVEYFNLQGMRVANPGTGLYIRRQGNEVKKVFMHN